MTADPLAALDFSPGPAPCECPACYAHPGRACAQQATWRMDLHEIHGCNKPDLTPDGAAVRLVCEDCLQWHVKRAEELATRAQMVFKMTGGILVCKGCQRPLTEVDSFLKVEAYQGG